MNDNPDYLSVHNVTCDNNNQTRTYIGNSILTTNSDVNESELIHPRDSMTPDGVIFKVHDVYLDTIYLNKELIPDNHNSRYLSLDAFIENSVRKAINKITNE